MTDQVFQTSSPVPTAPLQSLVACLFAVSFPIPNHHKKNKIEKKERTKKKKIFLINLFNLLDIYNYILS